MFVYLCVYTSWVFLLLPIAFFVFKNICLVWLPFSKPCSGKSWEWRGEIINMVWENLSGDSQHEPVKCSLQGWQPATAQGQNVGAEPKRGKRSVNSDGECRGNQSVVAEVAYKKQTTCKHIVGNRQWSWSGTWERDLTLRTGLGLWSTHPHLPSQPGEEAWRGGRMRSWS